jgi:hypothetical protein
MKLKYRLVREVFRSISLQILSLNERDWRRFCSEQVQPVGKAWEEIGRQRLDEKLSQGAVSFQDLELLMLESEYLGKARNWRLGRVEKRLLSKKGTIERLLVLQSIAHVQLLLGMTALGILLEPLSDLNQLVHRRFAVDENWTVAVAVLAVHENLIKRKLADLGVEESAVKNAFTKRRFARIVLDVGEGDRTKRGAKASAVVLQVLCPQNCQEQA